MNFTLNGNTIMAMLALFATLVGYAKLYYDQRHVFDVRLKEIEVKVDAMWGFQLRRGLNEGERLGLLKHNSPIAPTAKASKMMEPLVPELVSFYKAIDGDKVPLIDLVIMLEQQFGRKLTETVCKIVGLHEAACLLIAASKLRKIDVEEIRSLGTCHVSRAA